MDSASVELVDTHCHIQSVGISEGESTTLELWAKAPQLSGDALIERARECGVSRLICVGCDLEDSRLAAQFVKNRANCWASIGLHPHEARRYRDQNSALDDFAALVAAPKVVAIGECGLDYFYEHSGKADQKAVLEFQLQLARKNDLPLIFHVREAFADFWPIYDRYNDRGQRLRGVVHSFTDSQENLEQALERGLYIGVNGIATFAKTEAMRSTYRAIPLNRLVLETDAPFLTPAPYRGTINESKYVRVIAEFMAKLRGESINAIAGFSTDNARNLFGLT